MTTAQPDVDVDTTDTTQPEEPHWFCATCNTGSHVTSLCGLVTKARTELRKGIPEDGDCKVCLDLRRPHFDQHARRLP